MVKLYNNQFCINAYSAKLFLSLLESYNVQGKTCVPDPKHPKYPIISHYQDNGKKYCQDMFNHSPCTCPIPCKEIHDDNSDDVSREVSTTNIDVLTTQGNISEGTTP